MAVVRACVERSQQILRSREEAGITAWKLTMESEPGLTPLLVGPHAALLTAFALDKCPPVCSWGRAHFLDPS